MTTKARYFIGSDNSGHKYVVPAEQHEAWSEWANLPEDDERAWEAPEYATRIPGALSLLTFSDPVVE